MDSDQLIIYGERAHETSSSPPLAVKRFNVNGISSFYHCPLRDLIVALSRANASSTIALRPPNLEHHQLLGVLPTLRSQVSNLSQSQRSFH